MDPKKEDIIKRFLSDESIPGEKRRDRFEIAWDVCENLESIKEDMRKKLTREIVRQLHSKEFIDFLQRGDYEIVNLGIETKGMINYPLKVFKHSWR